MGYITLTITNNEQTKEYVLFHAEYLDEAWLARVNEDDTTRIIKQFQCKRMENCFNDAAKLISRLGQVTKMAATDVEPHIVTLLQNHLENRPQQIPAYPDVADFNLAFATQTLWDWIGNSLPTLKIAS